MNQPPIEHIAAVARHQMERFASRYKSIGDCNDLTCYCAIASHFFYRLAREFNHPVNIVEGIAFDERYAYDENGNKVDLGPNHCWTTYQDRIIDLTATQFSHEVEPVHITDINDENYYVVHEGHKVMREFKSWPPEQNPYRYSKRIEPYFEAAKKELTE